MANKKFLFSIFASGIIGGFIVLFGSKFFQDNKEFVFVNNDHNARQVSYTHNSPPMSFTKAAKLGTEVVVHIRAEESDANAQKRLRNGNPWDSFFFRGRMQKMKGGGSGVIISHDGYIVTNNHVVDFADNIIVTLSNSKEYKATKIGTDPATDLAVLKINETNLPTLKNADSDKAQLGEWVLAIGNPFDYLTSSVTAGIISAKGRNINIIQDKNALEEFIQTDAAVNPGSSGGALVDTEGRLLGITSAIATPNGTFAGYSFAIPSNLMINIVDEIIKKGGNIQPKVSLGVSVATINKQIQDEKNLSLDHGVFVHEVITGSAAEFGGMLPEDIIVKANEKTIKNYEDLKEVLNLAKIGDILKLKVFRNNKYITIRVKLKQSL